MIGPFFLGIPKVRGLPWELQVVPTTGSPHSYAKVVSKLATPYLGTHLTALDDLFIVGLRLFVPSCSCKNHSSRASGCGEIRPRIFQVGQPDGPIAPFGLLF